RHRGPEGGHGGVHREAQAVLRAPLTPAPRVRPPAPAPGRAVPSCPIVKTVVVFICGAAPAAPTAPGGDRGAQRTASDHQTQVDREDRLHLRDPQEPAEQPGPPGAAQVRPRHPPARGVPRGALAPPEEETAATAAGRTPAGRKRSRE